MKRLEELIQAAESSGDPGSTSTRLKSKIFSRLIELGQAEGPLRPLSECAAHGEALCVFESLVAATGSEKLESKNPCAVCHGRVISERVENAPIYWPGCPYAKFSGH